MFTLLRKLPGRYRYRRRRHALRAATPADLRILEIGAGFNPFFDKSRFPNARHLDHGTREELVEKYRRNPIVSGQVDRIQPVDFVWRGEPLDTLLAGEPPFDLIFSSHCLEHQTDLLGHLRQLERVLAPAGRMHFIVPDKRFTFDAVRPMSCTGDVLAAAYGGTAGRHTPGAMFDYLASIIDLNDGLRVRRRDLRQARFQRTLADAWAAFQDHASVSARTYEDCHAWVLTPPALELIVVELFLLGLLDLVPHDVTSTAANEFHAILHRPPAGDASRAALRDRLAARRMQLHGDIHLR